MENKGTRVIETQRLLLRPFVLSDAEAMYRNWASDTEVTRFLTWPGHPNVEFTRAVLESWVARYSDPAYYQWAMELKDIGEVIGSISAVKLREDIASADMGYCMGRAWWGKELMPEALCAVVQFLFEEVGMNRIAATHDINNPKSGRVMQKAGMQKEGILRAAGRNNVGICDEVWYSILRQDYRK